MDPVQLGGKLFSLTGALQPSDNVTAADLQKARAALAATLNAGIATDTRPPEISSALGEAGSIQFAQLDPTVQQQFSGIQTAQASPGFISDSPVIASFNPAVPAWARGMAITAVGPFQEEANPVLSSWVHIIFPLPQAVNVKYGTQIVAVVTLSGAPVAGKSSLPLAAGSVWMDAQFLAVGCPASSWTGFSIKGGTLTLGQYTVANGEIVIGVSANFTLKADLAQPAPPPPITGPGADASAIAATLPASITVAFTPSSATITALGNISATIYGSAVAIKKNAQAPVYNANLAALFVPGDISGPAQFVFKSVKSTLFIPAGSAPIAAAGWILPVAITTPDKLGQAAGMGGVALALGAGATATWAGISTPVAAAGAVIAASPGELLVWTTLPATPFATTWTLWNGKLRPCTIEFTIPKSGVLFFLASAAPTAGEELLAGGSTVAHIDRPVQATGLGVAVSMPVASLVIVQTAAVPTGGLIIEGAAPLAKGAEPAAFALENALIEALPPQFLIAAGTLEGNNVVKGSLLLQFGLTAFLPTLPDPYATSLGLIGNAPPRETGPNAPSPQPIGLLRSRVTWTTPATPALNFQLIFAQSTGTTGALLGTTLAVSRQNPGVNLLDVSSNASQLGVNWAPQSLRGVNAQGLLLIGDGAATSLFTVSAISWEPMRSTTAIPAAPSDGVPSKLNVPTVSLAPIAPIPLMTAQQSRVAGGDPYSFTATLPFGMIAEASNTKGATYNFVQPKFDGYDGGYQISLVPAGAQSSTKPEFPGQTVLTDPYGTAVLSSDVATIFRADFRQQTGAAEPGVPVTRYDLSGYGASLFSEWYDPNVTGTGILKVQFTVWVGRTAYEVVRAQSIIYPWGIKIVRTITIQRISGGDVTRQDSGWQAATPGQFNFPTKTAGEFNGAVHQGSVDGVFNVKNIRDNGAQFPLDGITYVPVLFDADVKINTKNPVVSGASQNVYVPSQNITGWAQLAPDNSPATRADLADLLEQKGAALGPIACTINIGAAGQQMKVSSVGVSAVGSGETAVFVASLNGTPVLSRDGQWSMAVKTGGSTPVALNPQTAVPLIQPNGSSTWYLAEPADILNLTNPTTQYGYLQGTSTQKTFFGQPQIPQGANKVSIPNPPHVADVGALLGSTGIFPDLTKALAFPNPQDLLLGALGEDTLALNQAPFTVNQPPLTLVDFGPVSCVLVYADRSQAGNPPTTVTYTLNPAGNPAWSISFEKFTFVLVSPFGDVNNPLLQVVGSAHADANTAPALGKLTIVYGSILSLVQQIFSKLSELASFLPGGNESKLDISFSNGQLTIRDKFALPTLPLGLGDITNVALDLGATMQFSPMSMDFTAGIASPDDPFQWLVDPLSGTGCVQVGFQNGNANLLIQAGIGVGLAIDVGIAEGSASIVLAFQVDNTVSPFEVKVILTGQASVDVLGGLASASIMLSAGLAIIPALPDITLIGSVAVGIHISICWVVNIDFDGSWQFSQTLTA